MIKASVFTALQTSRKYLVPGIHHFSLALASAQCFNYTITLCLKAHFQDLKWRGENNVNSFAKDVTSSYYNYTNYLMEHLFSILLLKLHFLRVLWVMGITACKCVRHANENIVAPLYRGQASDLVIYCTYGCRGNTILTPRCAICVGRRENIHCEFYGKHLGPPPLGLFKLGSMLNSYNLICFLYKYTPRRSHTIKQTCRLHLEPRTYLS